jgi:signal transduction histidine kinase
MPKFFEGFFSGQRPPTEWSRPVASVVTAGVLLIVLVIAGSTAFLASERTRELARSDHEITNLATILSEQTDRSFQALQTVQRGLVERMRLRGIDSEDQFVHDMSGRDVYELLRAQIRGLPYVNVISLIGADGKLINFSRYWPIPDVHVADRDYFRAFVNDSNLRQFISKPVENRINGDWSIFLARKFTAPNGKFLGLVLSLIKVSYFEDFFRSVLPSSASAIAVFRNDGTLLARYPHGDAVIGSSYMSGVFKMIDATGNDNPHIIYSRIDGTQRIVTHHSLAHFPLIVSVSTTEAAALKDWRHEVIMLGTLVAIAIGAIAATVFFAARSVRREIQIESLGVRMRAERAETLLTEAIDSISEGFVIFDANDRLVMCNEAYKKAYPRSAELMVPGANFREILRYGLDHGEYADAVGREDEWLEERLDRHHAPAATIEQVMSDGRHLLVVERRTPSGLSAGLRLDVTALRSTEAQLYQAQKMESIGQLTGGIAHDFNNMLGTIVGNLDLLAERTAGNPSLATPAGEALDAALRAAELNKRLLAFARKQPLRPQAVDVAKQLGGLTNLLKDVLGETITVRVMIRDGLWPIVADPAQLESAIVNLAVNARDAMSEGGTIMIEASNKTLDADYAMENAEVTPGDYVAITVTDNGPGMTPEVLAHAFEPFFTTKPTGKGTGLGLSQVYGFAKQSAGHAKIYSELGHGTTVKIYLPRTRDKAQDAPAPAEARPASLPTGSEIVLLAEDNDGLRRTTSRVLREFGYRVLEAENGPTALQILHSDEPIDLLFTDVVMAGGMSGYELAANARRTRPGLKILFATGFAEMSGRPNADDNTSVLSKPYRKDEVAQKIRSMLDGG